MSLENFDDLSDLEAALQRLSPRPVGLDRDRLMFEAGGLALRRRFWPIVSGGLAAAAVLLLVLLIQRPGPRIIEHVVYVPSVPPPTDKNPARQPVRRTTAPVQLARAAEPVEAASDNPRQTMEAHLLRWGLDGLPDIAPSVPSEPPLSVPRLLGVPAQPAAEWGLFRLGSWFHEGEKS